MIEGIKKTNEVSIQDFNSILELLEKENFQEEYQAK